MKQQDALFTLIHSLSRHEKKYFRMHSGMRGGDKKYLLLFDAIEKQITFDEKAVRKKLSGEKFLRQLPVAKNYLFKSIMKSLRAYHSGNTIDHELREGIRDVEILYAKGLYRLCRPQLQRLYSVAKENGKYKRLLEIIRLQRNLARVQGYPAQNRMDTERAFREEKEVFAITGNLQEYDILSDRYFLLVAKTNDPATHVQQELNSLRTDRLLTDETAPLSYQARIFFYLINSRLHHNLGDLRAGYRYGKKHIELLEKLPPRLFREEKYNYIIALYNHLIILTYLARNREFEQTIGKLRNLKTENDRERTTVFYTTLTELDFYIAQKKFSRGSALEKSVAAGFERFAGKINRQVELALCYNLSYVFIGSGKYRRALFWVNKVLNYPEPGIRTDIYCMARLLNLIIHYELGNTELLSHLANSTTRYLKKREFFGDAEELLIRYFGSALSNIHSAEERKNVFRKLKKDFVKLSVKQGDKTAGALFDFSSWINSKIAGGIMEKR